MDAGRPRFEADRREREELAERFFDAFREGDVDGLRELLAADIHHDLGADYYESRINKDRKARSLASQLQAITGQKIMIRSGKAVLLDTEVA